MKIMITASNTVINAMLDSKQRLDFSQLIPFPEGLTNTPDKHPLVLAAARREVGERLLPLAVNYADFLQQFDDFPDERIDDYLSYKRDRRNLKYCRLNMAQHGYFGRTDFMLKEWGVREEPTLVARSSGTITINATSMPYIYLEALSRKHPEDRIDVKRVDDLKDKSVACNDEFALKNGVILSSTPRNDIPFDPSLLVTQINRYLAMQSMAYRNLSEKHHAKSRHY